MIEIGISRGALMVYPKIDPVMFEDECGYWLCGSDGMTNAAWKTFFTHLQFSEQSPLLKKRGKENVIKTARSK